MNQKELREIRKRFTLDKDSISHVYGCYVNAAKDIVARMDMSMGLMEQEEAELYLKLLKKSISGTLGKNLLDIEFSTKQVEDSDEHRLLQALRQSHLRDEDMRELFYKRVIESLDFGDDSYVILLASDSYDIPFKGRDDELWEEGSNEVFDYIICCICPVKDARASLRYFAEEQNFRGASSGHVLGNPELGFMFPSFDDRSTNIYNALYYSRGLVDIHHEFIDGIFHIDRLCLREHSSMLSLMCFANPWEKTAVWTWSRRSTGRSGSSCWFIRKARIRKCRSCLWRIWMTCSSTAVCRKKRWRFSMKPAAKSLVISPS